MRGGRRFDALQRPPRAALHDAGKACNGTSILPHFFPPLTVRTMLRPMRAASSADLPALLARVALGDRAAFRALYDATQAHLFSAARRITRNDSVAAEVLQEAFMAVWHRASSYDASRAAPMTWLITIVRNRAFDRLSLASARHETALPDGDVDALWDAHDHESDASVWAEEAVQRRRLHECMRRLEPQQRQSLALAFLQGLSHMEVAQHMGRPLGSVKGWIRRAMLHLRDCVGAAA
jgi:RNA polymerase sigma-70 factor, ECF subfamily